MSLLDRLISLSLLEVNMALAKVENPEQVRDALLREVSGVLESAGAELRQLQRSRDALLENRRAAEKETDAKRAALNAAAEAEKAALKKQADAFDEALVRMDEQIAEQNREEATLHKYVAALQEIRREASEWSPRRRETKAEQHQTESASTRKETSHRASSTSTKSGPAKETAEKDTKADAPNDAAPPREPDAIDPMDKMRRLKEKMEAFQSRHSIDEEELRAFETEKAIAEEETKRVIEENLAELKKKMNRG